MKFNSFSMLALAAVSFALVSCDEMAENLQAPKNPAVAKVSNHQIGVDAFVVDGQWDYGAKVTMDLQNIGQAGSIFVTVILSTSEGQWVRTQNLSFEAGETKSLSYVFTEPTVNATNIQYRIKTNP